MKSILLLGARLGPIMQLLVTINPEAGRAKTGSTARYHKRLVLMKCLQAERSRKGTEYCTHADSLISGRSLALMCTVKGIRPFWHSFIPSEPGAPGEQAHTTDTETCVAVGTDCTSTLPVLHTEKLTVLCRHEILSVQ